MISPSSLRATKSIPVQLLQINNRICVAFLAGINILKVVPRDFVSRNPKYASTFMSPVLTFNASSGFNVLNGFLLSSSPCYTNFNCPFIERGSFLCFICSQGGLNIKTEVSYSSEGWQIHEVPGLSIRFRAEAHCTWALPNSKLQTFLKGNHGVRSDPLSYHQRKSL